MATPEIIILQVYANPDASFIVNGVFWLIAPSNNIVELPGFQSQVPYIDSANLSLLQDGTIIEQSFTSGTFPAGTTLTTVQSTLQTQYSTAQTALSNTNLPISGVVGTIYNGTSWTSTTPFNNFSDHNPSIINQTTQIVLSNSTVTASGSYTFAGFIGRQVNLFVNILNAPTGSSPTIQFTVQEIDPGNSTTSIGTSVTGSTLNSATTQELQLNLTSSTVIQVSWTVTGSSASFTGVYATLTNKSTTVISGFNPSGAETGLQADSGGHLIVVGEGTAGSPAGGIITIQGNSSGTPVPITGSISATNPSVSTTGTAVPASATYIGADVVSSAPSLSAGNLAGLTVSTAGRLLIDGSQVTQPVSGTVSATQGTSPWVTNLTQINGNAVVTAASGVQKVGIVGNSDSTLDATLTAGTAPTNGLSTLAQYNTTQPSPSNTQTQSLQADQVGNLLNFPNIQIKTGSAWTNSTGVNTLQYATGTTTQGAPLGGVAVLIEFVTNSALTGGAVTFQGSWDNGQEWVTIPVAQVLNPQNMAQQTNPYTLSASGVQPFLILLQGYNQIRMNLTTVISGTGALLSPYWSVLPALSSLWNLDAAGNIKINIAGQSTDVEIVGHTGSSLDGSMGGGTSPTNGLGVVATYSVNQPTPSFAQVLSLQCDQVGNLLSFPGVQTRSGSSWGSSTALNTVQYPTGSTSSGPPTGAEAIIVQLDQLDTFTGGVVTFQGTYDNGNSWVTIPAAQVLNPQTFIQVNNPYTFIGGVNQPFLFLLQGFQQIRANLTTVITGTAPVVQFFWTVLSGISPVAATNVTQINGNSIQSAAIGMQRVGIAGYLGSQLDAAGQNATAPAAELIVGGEYNTTPSTITSGNVSPLQLDSSGNLRVNINAQSLSNVTVIGTTAAGSGASTGLITIQGNASGTPVPVSISGTLAVTQSTSPWIGGDAQTTETTAAWTTSTALNTTLALTVTNYSSVTVTLNQTSTITGGNVTFEVSDTSAGTNWYSISMTSTSGANFIPITTYTLAASTNASFQGNISAYVQFRVRLSTTISGTGTVNVGIAASSAAATFQHAAYITDASHGPVAVKGASTAAAASDPALVVAVSPNNTVAVTQSTSPWADNITQFGGTNISTGTGASGAGIPRVTVSNDSNILATQSGAWTVTANQGTANTISNAWPIELTDGQQTANVSAALGLQVDSNTPTGTAFSEYPVVVGAVDLLGNAQNLVAQNVNGVNSLTTVDPTAINKLDMIILLLTDIRTLLISQSDGHVEKLLLPVS